MTPTEQHEVYRDGKVHVLREMCATCVFRPGNLMSLKPGRLRGMVDESRAQPGGMIVCHSTLYTDEHGHAVCRGYFDRHGQDDPIMRLALAMSVIEWQEL